MRGCMFDVLIKRGEGMGLLSIGAVGKYFEMKFDNEGALKVGTYFQKLALPIMLRCMAYER